MALAVALALAGPADAAHVTGVVNTIQRPLGGAQVIVLETGTSAVSDSLGRYDLGDLPAGVWSVRVVAVGYATQSGTVSVSEAGASVPSTWLMKPLHPDGAGLTRGLLVPRPTGLSAESSADTSGATPHAPPNPPPHLALRDTLSNLPEPAPVAPLLDLYLSPDEASGRGALPGPLGELLPKIATADSLTRVSEGTSAPGEETWRQWGDRLGAWATANPGDVHVPLAHRAVAYTRTRLALAAGPTWPGYADARVARAAVATARLDVATGPPGGPGAAFLDSLSTRIDATFVPGSVPPRPVPVAKRHVRHHRKRRTAHK
jgi:hypothetical protein